MVRTPSSRGKRSFQICLAAWLLLCFSDADHVTSYAWWLRFESRSGHRVLGQVFRTPRCSLRFLYTTKENWRRKYNVPKLLPHQHRTDHNTSTPTIHDDYYGDDADDDGYDVCGQHGNISRANYVRWPPSVPIRRTGSSGVKNFSDESRWKKRNWRIQMNTKENGIWRVNERERRSKSDRRNEKKCYTKKREEEQRWRKRGRRNHSFT